MLQRWQRPLASKNTLQDVFGDCRTTSSEQNSASAGFVRKIKIVSIRRKLFPEKS
jgi:hypothetical protein